MSVSTMQNCTISELCLHKHLGSQAHACSTGVVLDLPASPQQVTPPPPETIFDRDAARLKLAKEGNSEGFADIACYRSSRIMIEMRCFGRDMTCFVIAHRAETSLAVALVAFSQSQA